MNIPAVNVEAASEARRQSAAEELVTHYQRVADRLPGSREIRVLRDAAIRDFAAKGLPHRRIEEWKYTDLRRLMTEAYAPALGDMPRLTAAQLEDWLGEAAGIDAVKLVLVNGVLDERLSSIGELASGVEVRSLADALQSPPDWLTAALGKINEQNGEIVTLLNTAFMSGGVVLRLADGVALPRPVHLIHVAAGDEPLAASIRNVLLAGKGVEATFIESYVSAKGTAAQINAVTEVRAASGAKLRHYKIDSENHQSQHLASAMIDLADGADYLGVSFADGAALARHQTFLTFNGDGTRAHFYGAQLLCDRQHCDMTLLINHDAVGCESREHVKAVLTDQAQGVFQAKVIVQPGAQKTDGRQMAQGLLLSENAEFDAKPELEIYADDVKCNHGATCGALDEDLMFYLRTRGILEPEARSLLIQAFIGEVLDKVEHEGLREALVSKAARWLG
ncbi:MAG: Fe-S cluster assembly protein SufD [Rhodomicrobiaceae bacterium]